MQTLPARTTDLSPAELRRIVVAIVIGNGFVAYDFTVYSFAAVAIGNLFFPSSNPASSLLLSLATFGAGFVMRPLGAVMIGHIADSRGRRAGLTVSIALMTLGTWMIACLPGYASRGNGPVRPRLPVAADCGYRRRAHPRAIGSLAP